MLIRLLVLVMLCIHGGITQASLQDSRLLEERQALPEETPAPENETPQPPSQPASVQPETPPPQSPPQQTPAPQPAPGATSGPPPAPGAQPGTSGPPPAPGAQPETSGPPPAPQTSAPGTSGSQPASGTPAPQSVPEKTPTPAPGATLKAPISTFNASALNDWIVEIPLNISPVDKNGVHFIEGEKKVKLGESTKLLKFGDGKVEGHMLFVPVTVLNRTQEKINFKAEFNGKTVPLTINVIGEPPFKLVEDKYTATEKTKWMFVLKIESTEPQNYTFTEGDKTVHPGQSTKSLQFGDVTKQKDTNEYHVPVNVLDLAKNNITFYVGVGKTKRDAIVMIEPPTKPKLLKDKFEVNKANNFTFTLEIKSKTVPQTLTFTEGNDTVKAGNATKSFTFGQMTNDVNNLYNVEVKVTPEIKDPLSFDVIINGTKTTVKVSKKSDSSESSAMSSAPMGLSCIFVTLIVMLIK